MVLQIILQLHSGMMCLDVSWVLCHLASCFISRSCHRLSIICRNMVSVTDPHHLQSFYISLPSSYGIWWSLFLCPKPILLCLWWDFSACLWNDAHSVLKLCHHKEHWYYLIGAKKKKVLSCLTKMDYATTDSQNNKSKSYVSVKKKICQNFYMYIVSV